MFNELGFFQFSNLVRNRVPFTLFCVDFDVPPIFNDYNDRQVEQFKSLTTTETLPADIKKLNLPNDWGIVLINADGEGLPELAVQLESLGYKNVFYVAGGFEGLIDDKANF